MKKILAFTALIVTIVFAACSKDEGVADNPTTLTLAKKWFVRTSSGTGAPSAYTLFSTRAHYVTVPADAFGNEQQVLRTDTLTLDDHNMLRPTLRANARIVASARTFGAGTYKNWNDTTNAFILKEGKIIRNGGKSRSGTAVDSIYLRYAFQNAPAVEYTLNGHARTGLLKDEY